MNSGNPSRRCLGCRRVRPRKELIRMVRDPDGMVTLDIGSRLPGRGAYVCPSEDCLGSAMKKKLLHMAFGVETKPVPAEESLKMAGNLLERQFFGLLGLAARAGSVVSGHDAALKSLEDKKAHLLVAAQDLSVRTRGGLMRQRDAVRFIKAGTITKIGRAIGRRNRGIVAITDPSFSLAMLACYDKLISLGLSLSE